MSLYGNVKRIGSSTFQFDRVYNNRKQMEDNCSTDGVYAGRYVLINYGQRSTRTDLLNLNQNEILNVGQRYEKVEGSDTIRETETYAADKAIDVQYFGASYDSTVWQKIYGPGSGEKYIMVAELNALAPKLELVLQDPIIYKNATVNGLEPEDISVADPDNPDGHPTTAANAYETWMEPSFDLKQSNEFTYYLNMPKTLKLNVNNENINYNANGFNMVYAIPKGNKDDQSYIVWRDEGTLKPENFSETDPPTAQETSDKKTLLMNLPQFGNLMQDLYNLIYGIPQDNTYVRPFFKPYWSDTYGVVDEHGVPVLDENDDQIEKPRSYSDDPYEYLENIPTIGEILANNTEGLAGILSSLFTERDPLTGTVRYYLITDWANEIDYNTSGPFITGKPEVVGIMSEFVVSTTQNGDTIHNTLATLPTGDFTIDYTTWKLVRS